MAREQPETGLNEKQERFCQEYIKDLNGTQAAIRAGYSKRAASQGASELLANPKVAFRVAELKEASLRRNETEADMLLRQLVEQATADVADIIDENGNLKPIKEWPLAWRQGLITGLDIQRIQGDDAETIVHKVRMADRTKSRELLGKHIKVLAWKEVHQHDINVDHAAILAEARKRVGKG